MCRPPTGGLQRRAYVKWFFLLRKAFLINQSLSEAQLKEFINEIHTALDQRYSITEPVFIEEYEVQAEERLEDLLADADSFLESLLSDSK